MHPHTCTFTHVRSVTLTQHTPCTLTHALSHSTLTCTLTSTLTCTFTHAHSVTLTQHTHMHPHTLTHAPSHSTLTHASSHSILTHAPSYMHAQSPSHSTLTCTLTPSHITLTQHTHTCTLTQHPHTCILTQHPHTCTPPPPYGMLISRLSVHSVHVYVRHHVTKFSNKGVGGVAASIVR